MHKYTSTSKWIVFNNKGKRIKTVILKHKSNLLYEEIEPFEAGLKQQGLYAHRAECFKRDDFKGISFREQLECLCWKFNDNGIIIGWNV